MAACVRSAIVVAYRRDLRMSSLRLFNSSHRRAYPIQQSAHCTPCLRARAVGEASGATFLRIHLRERSLNGSLMKPARV